MITFITGHKDVGKTYYLYNWYKKDPKGIGVISTKLFKDNMHVGYDLLFLPSKYKLSLCTKLNNYSDTNIIQGQYFFNSVAFTEAYDYVRKSITLHNTIWIDEIGELELKHEGFYPIISLLNTLDCDLRIGIRLSCVFQFIRMMNINEYHIIYITSR